MNRIFSITLAAALAIGSLPTPVFADVTLCKSMGKLAGDIMRLRQNDHPMSEAMEAVASLDGDADDKEFFNTFVTEAYSRPSFMAQKYKDQAVAKFRNEAEVQCFMAFKKK